MIDAAGIARLLLLAILAWAALAGIGIAAVHGTETLLEVLS